MIGFVNGRKPPTTGLKAPHRPTKSLQIRSFDPKTDAEILLSNDWWLFCALHELTGA